MNRILLIEKQESDLSILLKKSCDRVTVISADTHSFNTDEYDSLCIIGGNTDDGIILNPHLRICVEEFRGLGKPIFCEFVRSISGAYTDTTLHTTHHRLVFDSKVLPIEGLESGAVLDGHENDCIKFAHIPPNSYPILTYHNYVCAHSHIDMSEEEYKNGICAMWKEENLIVCAFRLCNFRRARLAPKCSFEALIKAIVLFLAGEEADVKFDFSICRYEKQTVGKAADVEAAVVRGLDWFVNAKMLNDDGKNGVKEGFSHHINAKNGVQKRALQVRTDCVGEVAGAFMFRGFLAGNATARVISENMFDFIFNCMQVKDGVGKGMLRWTEIAWDICYGDDVARAIIGLLLAQHFGRSVPHFNEICKALDFLADTTSPEGIRVARTSLSKLDQSKLKEITTSGAGLPSAHYNSYYHAALLLAYRAGGDPRYLDIAEKGLRQLMSLYPDTYRETSETEENCRLLFPIAVLYGITKKEEHHAWLCRVSSYLDEHRHECGAVPEWDTGYRASCSRNHTGECALLANNGDSVVDLLYSNNWLPLGYAYAYLVTGEERFYTAWCEIASFLLSCQIHSDDRLLDGAWTRAFDLENWESHGVPHDVGWAPCCIETGWTMGEILMGLQFMEQVERIKLSEKS